MYPPQKRDTNDWWSLLEDIIYDNDSGSDDDADDENICRWRSLPDFIISIMIDCFQ